MSFMYITINARTKELAIPSKQCDISIIKRSARYSNQRVAYRLILSGSHLVNCGVLTTNLGKYDHYPVVLTTKWVKYHDEMDRKLCGVASKKAAINSLHSPMSWSNPILSSHGWWVYGHSVPHVNIGHRCGLFVGLVLLRRFQFAHSTHQFLGSENYL